MKKIKSIQKAGILHWRIKFKWCKSLLSPLQSLNLLVINETVDYQFILHSSSCSHPVSMIHYFLLEPELSFECRSSSIPWFPFFLLFIYSPPNCLLTQAVIITQDKVYQLAIMSAATIKTKRKVFKRKYR